MGFILEHLDIIFVIGFVGYVGYYLYGQVRKAVERKREKDSR